MSNARITLHGAVCGPMWWPAGELGSTGWETIQLDRDRPLFEELADILSFRGDFQGASFTADSYVEITRYGGRGLTTRTRSRMVELATLPSIADLVEQKAFASDFYGGEE